MRIGCVPYLNARPLIDALLRQPAADWPLSLAAPSVLIRQLHAGELDIALASTFALFEHPAWQMVPGVGIVAAGPVLSVRLLSRVPIPAIRTLALDASSRSSNALARILLADQYGLHPTCVTLPPERDAMLAQADAAVLIGDYGLVADGTGLVDLDLGAAWWELTGLPFVFAGWLARTAAAAAEASPRMQQAAVEGMARREAIAAEEAIARGIPLSRCRAYLLQAIRYQVGAPELAGMAAFHRRAMVGGFLAEAVTP